MAMGGRGAGGLKVMLEINLTFGAERWVMLGVCTILLDTGAVHGKWWCCLCFVPSHDHTLVLAGILLTMYSPGRFFAVRVVKLLLVYVLVNFDIEVVGGKRPSNPWIGVSRGPPMGRLRLRARRQPEAKGRKLSV